MWFMNKAANPFVRLVLRSPLHGLFSASMLLLTYHGRKSGREYTLPAQYAQEEGRLYVISGSPEKKTWWRNLQGGAPVRVTLRGRTLAGNGIVLKPESEREKIVEGLDLYLRRFPVVAKGHGVRLAADGSPDPGDLQRAAAGIKMVCVELREGDLPGK